MGSILNIWCWEKGHLYILKNNYTVEMRGAQEYPRTIWDKFWVIFFIADKD